MKTLPRRTFLGWLSLGLVGCVKALEQLGTAAGGPGKTSSSYPSQSPTLFGSPTPLPTASPSGSPSPSSTASPTPAPTPSPTPQFPAVLDASHTAAAALSDVRAEAPGVLTNAVGFSVGKAGSDPIPDKLMVHVSATSKDISVFRAASEDTWEPANATIAFQETVQSVEQAPMHVVVTIAGVKNGDRYLVTGPEKAARIIDRGSYPTRLASELSESAAFPDDKGQYASAERQWFPEGTVAMGEKTLIVLVHGAGAERYPDELYLWKPLLSWLTGSAVAAEIGKRFIIAVHRYDSTREFNSGLADELISAMRAKYGPRHIILVGHSMGGLVSRYAYANAYKLKEIRSVITLGAPLRGTPLAFPKLMNLTFSTQPYPSFLHMLYQFFISRFFAKMDQEFLAPWFKPYKWEPSKWQAPLNYGLLSMCTYEEEFSVPTGAFFSKLSFGPTWGVPIPYTISPNDRKTTIDSAFCCNTQGAALKSTYVVAYGGYCLKKDGLSSARELFEKAKSAGGLDEIAKDVSTAMQQKLLRMIAFVIAPWIPTGTGRKRLFWDGLVPLEDALGLAEGPAIEGISLDGSPEHDDTVIASRKAPWVKHMHVFRGYSHLDLAVGRDGDSTYFQEIAKDLIALDDEIQAAKTSTLSEDDRKKIVARLRADFQNSSSDGIYTLPEAWIGATATGPNLAEATFTVAASYKGYNGWERRKRDFRAWLTKIGNEWYYQPKKQYEFLREYCC